GSRSHVGMNRQISIGDQAHLAPLSSREIHDPQVVVRVLVKFFVMHPNRLIVHRLGSPPPGNRKRLESKCSIAKADRGRLVERGVLLEAEAADKVRLMSQVAQVIMESAGTGIGPVNDCFNSRESIRFGRQRANLSEFLLEPETVVQWDVDFIEIRAASD